MNISSLSDLTKVANKIKDVLLPGDYIFLYGEIGVGKTTFTRLLINNYELENNLKKSEVLSPTFNIVYEYEVKNFNLKHYDFYRFKNEQDINNVGLFENSKNRTPPSNRTRSKANRLRYKEANRE